MITLDNALVTYVGSFAGILVIVYYVFKLIYFRKIGNELKSIRKCLEK